MVIREQTCKPGSVPLRASIINLTLPTLRLARATLRHRFTWNCSPSYARFTSLVSVAGTKHCCLTAVNRDGALCCPDFPHTRVRDRPAYSRAVYGNRTRLLGLGSRCTTDVLTPHFSNRLQNYCFFLTYANKCKRKNAQKIACALACSKKKLYLCSVIWNKSSKFSIYG